MEDKEISLCAFLDIEGAFDNTPKIFKINSMANKSFDSTMVRWVKSMLTNRIVKSTLLNETPRIKTIRGCPQRGFLSHLLLSIVVDSLINELTVAYFDTQGYANDIVIVIRGI